MQICKVPCKGYDSIFTAWCQGANLLQFAWKPVLIGTYYSNLNRQEAAHTIPRRPNKFVSTRMNIVRVKLGRMLTQEKVCRNIGLQFLARGLSISHEIRMKSTRFHEIRMKSTRFHEIRRILMKSIWNPLDFMKSVWNPPDFKLWAFVWWSSIGLSTFERPIIASSVVFILFR